MMLKKYYIGIAVVLLLALYVSRQYQNHTESPAQQRAQLTNGSIAEKAHDNHAQENTKDSKWDPPRWYRLFTWPDGVTTWALMLTLLAIAEQTKETAKAAKAAQESAKATQDSIPHQAKAAEAALLNARAVIDSERAWLVVSVTSPETNRFVFTAKNVGRTTANITAIYAKQIPFGRSDKDMHIPHGSDRTSPVIFPLPKLLPPDAAYVVHISNIEEINKGRPIPEWIDSIEKGFSKIFFWGELEYTNPVEGKSGEVHITRWLYMTLPTKAGICAIPDPFRPEFNTYT